MKHLKLYIIIGLSVIVLLFTNKSCNDNRAIEAENNRVEFLQDSLQTVKTKNGNYISEISDLQVASEKDFKEMESGKDALIEKLQWEVKKAKGKVSSGVIIETGTNISVAAPTFLVKDTLNAIVGYSGRFEDTWVIIESQASKDSTLYQIEIIDEVVILQKRVNPLFKKAYNSITVESKNPYSKVKNLKSFTVQEKSKKLNLSAGAYLVYDNESGNFKVQPGVGVSYTLIGIK